MKKVRVWFNHWFSTAYHIINLLKDDENIDFIVVGSNTDANCVYRAVCDEWEDEPIIDNASDYIDYCIQFCSEYRIDVFVPRRYMEAVSQSLERFDAIGVKVLVERDFTLISTLGDKAKTYGMVHDICNIPEHRVVTSVEEYEKAYKHLKTDENRVCFKFAVDEGATSFRVVDDCIQYSLKYNIGSKITYSDSVKTLASLDKFFPLLVMPYLSGDEISVDCLYMPNGEHILVPRYKSWTRSETIEYEQEIVQACVLFLNKFKLNFPCNLQFRYDMPQRNGVPYLLEVNTRMTGGIQLSCLATGVNIPNIAVNRLLGIEKCASYEQKTKVVSHIETPILLR